MFLPNSNTVLACFKDDSIHGWEADTFEYKYQLPKPEGEKFHFRAFAPSADGRLFVAGGRCIHTYIYVVCTYVRVHVCTYVCFCDSRKVMFLEPGVCGIQVICLVYIETLHKQMIEELTCC